MSGSDETADFGVGGLRVEETRWCGRRVIGRSGADDNPWWPVCSSFGSRFRKAKGTEGAIGIGKAWI